MGIHVQSGSKKTKKAIEALTQPGMLVETLVDNEMSSRKFKKDGCTEKGHSCDRELDDGKVDSVKLTMNSTEERFRYILKLHIHMQLATDNRVVATALPIWERQRGGSASKGGSSNALSQEYRLKLMLSTMGEAKLTCDGSDRPRGFKGA